MRSRVLALCLSAALLGGSVFFPRILQTSYTEAEFAIPKVKPLTETISVSGQAAYLSQREIYTDTAVIASDVLVSVGDYVQEGDIIAVINQDLTKNVLSNAVSVPGGEPIAQQDELMEMLGQYTGRASSPLAPKPAEQEGGEKLVPDCIYAPASGIVTELNLTSHVLSPAGKPAAVVADGSGRIVSVSVPQREINQVKLYGTCKISGAGLEGEIYPGTVIKIYPTAQASMTEETAVQVDILVDQADERLKPGFSVTAEIETAPDRDALIIPYESISQDSANQEFVFRYEQGKAVKQYIQTGREVSGGVEVLDGVSQEDILLITYGNHIPEGGRIHLKDEFVGS